MSVANPANVTLDVEPAGRTGIAAWAYPEESARDLRIDFIRGVVMFILVVVHAEIFSVFNFLVWERIGVVSGGEGFVILSGVVLGMVHRRKMDRSGWRNSAKSMLDRALQLYRVNVAVIALVGAFLLLPLVLDPSYITTFTNRGTGEVFQLFPSSEAPFQFVVAQALLLRIGPHQFQIMGLYVVLIGLAPFALWAFSKQRVWVVLGLCWIVYFKNWAFPARPTGAQFEYAFPILTWQLTFFHGLAFGYFKEELGQWFQGWRRRAFYLLAVPLFVLFAWFAWNNPNPGLPEWARLTFIEPETFRRIYSSYFTKNHLGILRLVNYLVVLVLGYRALTVFWRPIERTLGWFLIPIGQASLYVFICHVFGLMILFNIPYFSELIPAWGSGNLWLNTAGHAGLLLFLWFLVKRQFLFRWIPR